MAHPIITPMCLLVTIIAMEWTTSSPKTMCELQGTVLPRIETSPNTVCYRSDWLCRPIDYS